MDKFINELKEKKIISKNDIDNLKSYIDEKFKELSPYKRAEILSSSVHKILDKNLNGLPENCKPIIKTKILKSTFLKNKSLISLYDIFNSCIYEKDLMTNSIKQFLEWINSKVKNEIDESSLKEYASSINPDLNEIACSDELVTITNSEEKNNTCKKDVYLNKFNKKKSLICLSFILTCSFYAVTKIFNSSNNSSLAYFNEKKESYIENLDDIFRFSFRNSSKKYSNINLPEYMHYKSINESKLKEFLIKHNSLLAKEPYFSTILNTAKEFNLNPLVLFAITGQEQSFVPERLENASKIANNPFNVYHSWKEYNTNINDSSRIAARTVINLSKDMPKDNNPFLWIGKNYAEDKGWGKGVEAVFKELSEQIE